MNPIDLFIQRPILTLMLMLSLVVFGVLGYAQLGVDQMPNMEFPVVTVTAQLEGAAPEVMEEDVTEVLASALSGEQRLGVLHSPTEAGRARIEELRSALPAGWSIATEEAIEQEFVKKLRALLSNKPTILVAVPDSLISILPEKADPFLKWTTSPGDSEADSALVCDFQGDDFERPLFLSDPSTESM